MKPTPEERLTSVVRDMRRGDVPESLVQLAARLDEPPPQRFGGQMWSVASLVIATAVVASALWIIRSSALPPVGGPSANASPSQAIPTASTVPTPAGLLGLAVGGSQALSCDADFPSFSPDGRWLACGTQLESWPDLTTVAALAGSPLGWSAHDQLLVVVNNSQYGLVTPEGTAVDLNLNPGDMPEWSSDGQRLLIQSRVDDRLRLAVWTESGTTQPLVDLPAAGGDRIDLSADGNTVLRSSTSCGSSGGCQFAVTASRPDGSGAVSYGPVAGTAFPHLAADGSYWFALGAGTNLSMWAAPPGGTPQLLGQMRGSWPLADGGFAAANPAGVWRWRPGAVALEPVALPNGIDPGAILALSADLRQALVGPPPSTAFVDLVSGTKIAGPNRTNATAFWVSGGAFGIVFSGPPPTAMIVRLR
jgi:hypothetical protein